MPVIIAAIGAFFVSLFTVLLKLFTRKFVYSALYITIFTVITAAFILAIDTLLADVAASAPTNGFLNAGLSLLPGNATTCIGLVGAAHAIRYPFLFKAKFLAIKRKA